MIKLVHTAPRGPISSKDVVGLDERYCGFTHESSKEEVLPIKNKQANSKNKCKWPCCIKGKAA